MNLSINHRCMGKRLPAPSPTECPKLVLRASPLWRNTAQQPNVRVPGTSSTPLSLPGAPKYTTSLQKHQFSQAASCPGHSPQTCSSSSGMALAGCCPGSHLTQPSAGSTPCFLSSLGLALHPQHPAQTIFPTQNRGSWRVETTPGLHMSPVPQHRPSPASDG